MSREIPGVYSLSALFPNINSTTGNPRDLQHRTLHSRLVPLRCQWGTDISPPDNSPGQFPLPTRTIRSPLYRSKYITITIVPVTSSVRIYPSQQKVKHQLNLRFLMYDN